MERQLMSMVFDNNLYNPPQSCRKCGGRMAFKGVGEYKCESCGALEYDDYGKVRCYIEEHRGATAAEIEDAVGVSQKSIRQMLKEQRIEVSPDSKAFLQCEICGANLRSGRFCPKCESSRKQFLEEDKKRASSMKGVGMGSGPEGEEGAKRFRRK